MAHRPPGRSIRKLSLAVVYSALAISLVRWLIIEPDRFYQGTTPHLFDAEILENLEAAERARKAAAESADEAKQWPNGVHPFFGDLNRAARALQERAAEHELLARQLIEQSGPPSR